MYLLLSDARILYLLFAGLPCFINNGVSESF